MMSPDNATQFNKPLPIFAVFQPQQDRLVETCRGPA